MVKGMTEDGRRKSPAEEESDGLGGGRDGIASGFISEAYLWCLMFWGVFVFFEKGSFCLSCLRSSICLRTKLFLRWFEVFLLIFAFSLRLVSFVVVLVFFLASAKS